MPFQLLLVAKPEMNTTPEESVEYLAEFIRWLREFFHQVGQNVDEIDQQTGRALFQEQQIRFLDEVLDEMEEDGHFDHLYNLVLNIDPRMIRLHGLYGAQARWKFSNINFSFTRFIEQRTAALFDRLLSSIDALLDSILGAVPGGSAVKELKEAIRNSVTIATE